MNPQSNATPPDPIPRWQQMLVCSIGCASLALAVGYTLGKSSVSQTPPASYPPEMWRLGGRLLPLPIDLNKTEDYMPPAGDEPPERVSSGTAPDQPFALPLTKAE